MTGALVTGLLAGYGVAIPVGAMAVLIVSLTTRTSLKVGAAAGLGAATADGIYALVAVLGGAAVARAIEPIAMPLRWVAAAVLIGLAARTAIGAVTDHRDTAAVRPVGGLGSPGHAYLGVLGLTLLNPTTIVYFAALVLGRQAGQEVSAVNQAVFVLAAFAASASWQLVLAGGGSLIGRLLTGPRGRLATALISSAVIAVLAVGIVVAD